MATILVVEDEYAIASIVSEILEDEGYRVLSAVNGQQGLERLAAQPVDLVLLDFMMPILDGPGMFAAMQADPKLRPIPVVFMTSLEEAKLRRRCTGYAGFLRKPFAIDALPTVIASVLAQAGHPTLPDRPARRT